MSSDKSTIDFESRSACDLRKCGSWVYACHPTTEVLCLAFRLPHWPKQKVALWHPARPDLGIHDEGDTAELAELFRWILAGGLCEAHNAAFERSIWHNLMVPKWGWPAIPIANWRCSAAKAAAHALPRQLKDAGLALHLSTRKDETGHKVMMKLTKPRKPRKKEVETWKAKHGRKPMPRLWHESADLFDRLWAYCCQDVLAEEALSATLDDLSPQEQAVYTLDQVMNQRGFQLDQEAVETALALVKAETTLLNQELVGLTGGQVDRASQRGRLLAWFASEGLDIEDTQAATVATLLAEATLTPTVRRGLEILQALGKSSTAKYESMSNWAGADWRARGTLLYHGAGTGRWSGSGPQPHNYPKGNLDLFHKHVEIGWELLKTRDREAITAECGTVMNGLSCALRGTIVASPGKQLFVSDFSGIEARVLLWLADDQDGLDMFRNNIDPYCDMATDIYDRPILKADKSERQIGKFAILGLGFSMGWRKFVDTCAAFGVEISEEFSRRVVDAYRTKYWRVKQLWYDMEAAAIEAVQRKGVVVKCGKISFRRLGWYLYMILPSGRRIAYPNPQIKNRQMPWGDSKPGLSFSGVNPITRQWGSQHTFGGSLVENGVQSVARDLMAEALQRLEASRVYLPVLCVHDESVCEVYAHLGSIDEFDRLMTEVPAWSEGMPIAVESWSGPRYAKG